MNSRLKIKEEQFRRTNWFVWVHTQYVIELSFKSKFWCWCFSDLTFKLKFMYGMLLLLLSHFSHPTLCDPIDGSPPGSPVPGILQARILEWVAISFSNAWKWKVKVRLLSRVQPSAIPWTAAHQAPSSMGFSRQEYWSGVPLLCMT